MGVGRCEDNPTSDPNLAKVPYADPNTPINPSTPNTVPTPDIKPTPSTEPTEIFRKTKRPFGAFLESMEAYFHERNNGKTPYLAYQTKVDTYLKARGYRN